MTGTAGKPIIESLATGSHLHPFLTHGTQPMPTPATSCPSEQNSYLNEQQSVILCTATSVAVQGDPTLC